VAAVGEGVTWSRKGAAAFQVEVRFDEGHEGNSAHGEAPMRMAWLPHGEGVSGDRRRRRVAVGLVLQRGRGAFDGVLSVDGEGRCWRRRLLGGGTAILG